MLAINSAKQSSTKVTPFKVVIGRDPYLFMQVGNSNSIEIPEPPLDQLESHIAKFETIHSDVKKKISIAQDKMKEKLWKKCSIKVTDVFSFL